MHNPGRSAGVPTQSRVLLTCRPRIQGNSGKSVEYAKSAENGAEGRDRTADTTIFNRVLYQLSYLGMRRADMTSRTCGL
jgi:hypothetical protein